MYRSIVHIDVSSDFTKAFRRLPARIQRLADTKTDWFSANAYDPRLKTHKLSGQLESRWAFSVNREYRILFRFTDADSVLFDLIGTHAIYR